jgi:hypothetical protein
MNPDLTLNEDCRIIAEFEDDASAFATAEPEYVPVLAIPLPAFGELDRPPEPPPTSPPDVAPPLK